MAIKGAMKGYYDMTIQDKTISSSHHQYKFKIVKKQAIRCILVDGVK